MKPKIFAYYLPQFHQIEENDLWWGEGFTEWTNVRGASPLFTGHKQPRVPTTLGYYDIVEDDSIIHRQIELARSNGISGFCFYYYHFAPGKRLLDNPIERYLGDRSLDFPYCLMWANETWTRRWRGTEFEREILLEQDRSDALLECVAHDLARHFQDPRYLRVGDRPVLQIYRPANFDKPSESLKKLRAIWKEDYSLDVHLCGGLTYDESNPAVYGYDASFEFPPHWRTADTLKSMRHAQPVDSFQGTIFSYSKNVAKEISKPFPDGACYPTVMLNWDNTARKKGRAIAFHGFSLFLFFHWLRFAMKRAEMTLPEGNALVFINAWNEWAEGSYLEPDSHFDDRCLRVVKAVADDLDWQGFVGVADPDLKDELLRDTTSTAKSMLQEQIDDFEDAADPDRQGGRDRGSNAHYEELLEAVASASQRKKVLRTKVDNLKKRIETLETKLLLSKKENVFYRKSISARLARPFMKLESKIFNK